MCPFVLGRRPCPHRRSGDPGGIGSNRQRVRWLQESCLRRLPLPDRVPVCRQGRHDTAPRLSPRRRPDCRSRYGTPSILLSDAAVREIVAGSVSFKRRWHDLGCHRLFSVARLRHVVAFVRPVGADQTTRHPALELAPVLVGLRPGSSVMRGVSPRRDGISRPRICQERRVVGLSRWQAADGAQCAILIVT